MVENDVGAIIGLITDFGNGDNYVGIVKGVMKGVYPGAEIVDISHGVASYSVTNAQYCLYSSFRYFPAGTVFYIVVDPAVGTRRRALIAEDGPYRFVAPDNGILSAVLTGGARAFAIREERFGDVSSTFHGRDIFAPAAALLAGGSGPVELGDPVEDYERAPFPVFSNSGGRLEGRVVHVDKFGNVITSIPNSSLKGNASRCFRVKVGQRGFTASPARTFSDLVDGEEGILAGSSGLLELAVNCASLAERHLVNIDDPVEITNE